MGTFSPHIYCIIIQFSTVEKVQMMFLFILDRQKYINAYTLYMVT